MDTFLQDIRYGARMLMKSPGFVSVAVLSLALGIGANTAIFSLIDSLLLRPMPVEEADRLVSIFTTDKRNPGNLPVSHDNFKDYRDQNQVFSGVAAFTFAQMNLNLGGASEQVGAQLVSGNYFKVLDVRPALGRTFLPEEDSAAGAHPVVVLSHGAWERRFRSDPMIIGKTLSLNRQPFTVIGVAPKWFTGTFVFGAPDVWVPMSMHAVAQPGFDWYDTRRGLFLFVFGRLRPGLTIEQARPVMSTLARQLEQAYPKDNEGRGVNLLPLLEARINPNGQGELVQVASLLMTTVGIVLLIACANIANLLLARASGRRREIAIRLALGARRSRLVRQLLTESVLLSMLGGVVGLLVAFWALDVITGIDDLPFPLPLDEVGIEGRVLGFTFLLSVVTGLVFGVAPALQASKPDVVPVLKNEAVPAGRGYRGISLQKILVVSQVALSLVSLVAAGLFLRSLRQAQAIDPGFETRNVLVMSFNLGREGYTPERGQIFYQQIADRVAGLPGVRSATVAQNMPFAGGISRSVFLEGQEASARDRTLVQVNVVGPRYFETMGIPLVRGRDFAAGDVATAPAVVVINQTMAERFWPSQDPIGKRFKFFREEEYTQVIGVVRDSKYNGLAEDPQPFIYEPLRQDYTPAATLHVRTSADAASMISAVRGEVQALDRGISVFNIQTLQDQVDQSLGPQMMNVVLLTIFSALALLLAGIGIYGVASYGVSQRTHEIGIRMALGAERGAVLRLVLGQGMILVAIGLVLGLAVAFAGTRLLSSLLVGVKATDPLTFAGTSALLAAVAVVASYVPARRATRIDPLLALRYE